MIIKAIIGLGNPGARFDNTRHNIGFAVVDELARAHGGSWRMKDNMELAEIRIGDNAVFLIKPQTFMNSSGQVIPALTKKGIAPENILVVHDELELPFGDLKFKEGGGHKGHNGLRSIIDAGAQGCKRLRFGIGRPADKDEVGDYVLMRFTEPHDLVQAGIDKAVQMIEELFD
jgi:PTH1 family peptidyl-tRNA hydrolase